MLSIEQRVPQLLLAHDLLCEKAHLQRLVFDFHKVFCKLQNLVSMTFGSGGETTHFLMESLLDLLQVLS